MCCIGKLLRSFLKENFKITTTMSSEMIEMDAVSQEQREEQIKLAAYYLWKNNGEPQGTDVQDWLVAEATIDGEVEHKVA
jgi:hypothetical protein